MPDGNGSGPGNHPGVDIVELTGDKALDKAALEAALESGKDFLFNYGASGVLAVFATGYKK